MENNIKNSLNELINKFGINQTSKILGISQFEIVKKSGIKLNTDNSYLMIMELFDNNQIPKIYKEFELEIDKFVGTIIWKGELKNELLETIVVYATPFWDGDPLIPIDVENYTITTNDETWEYEQPDVFKTIKTKNEFENIDELIVWYNDIYLPTVYNVIIQKQIPLMRSEHFLEKR